MERRTMSYTSYDFPHTHFYESDLRELIEMYKKLSKEVDDLIAWKDESKAEYEDLINRINILENEVSVFINEVQQEFEELKIGLEEYIYEQVHNALEELILDLGSLEAAVRQLRIDVQNEIRDLRSDYLASDTALKFWLEARLEQFKNEIPDLTTVNVWNPVKGTVTSIQVCVNDLYNVSRTGALTAYEYDTMELTAAEYDALMLSAFDYDNFARDILGRAGVYKNPYYYMYSPFTGDYVTIVTVINELAFLHRSDALTAAEYDALDLTASDYDNEEITAYNYDWSGKTILV